MAKKETYKKLFRVEKGKVIGGVATGFGEFFGVDTIIVRLFLLLLVSFGGSGPFFYIILWVFLPTKKTSKLGTEEYIKKNTNEIKARAEEFIEEVKKYSEKSNMRVIVGLLFILLGIIFLLSNFGIWRVDFDFILILVVIAVGVMLLTRK